MTTQSIETIWDQSLLHNDVQKLEETLDVDLSISARDLGSGQTFRYHGDRKCKTASVIKFPILVHVAMLVHEGKLDWDQKLVLTEQEKVAGSGVLTKMTAGLEITVRDTATLMTIISDNTATNMLIELVGKDAINQRMRELGLPITTCNKKAYSQGPVTPESKEFGFGVTTPDEMVKLMQLVAENKIADEKTSAEIMVFLSRQQRRDAIPRLLPEGWKYAGKTGAIDMVRNDVGLVTATDGRRFALALFARTRQEHPWNADNPAVVALARIAKRLLVGIK
jgi:beta-lactamase class A